MGAVADGVVAVVVTVALADSAGGMAVRVLRVRVVCMSAFMGMRMLPVVVVVVMVVVVVVVVRVAVRVPMRVCMLIAPMRMVMVVMAMRHMPRHVIAHRRMRRTAQPKYWLCAKRSCGYCLRRCST